MTTTGTNPYEPGHTARILAFPIRERVAAQASPLQRLAAMEAAAGRYPAVATGASWYHDEAIAEATSDQPAAAFSDSLSKR